MSYVNRFWMSVAIFKIKGVEMGPTMKILFNILILISIEFFTLDSLWNFLSAFFKHIWPSSYDFQDRKKVNGSQTQNDDFFYFKSDLYAFKKNEFLRKKSNIESANRFAIAFTVSKIWRDQKGPAPKLFDLFFKVWI